MDEDFIGKPCKIFLKNRWCFTGTILSLTAQEVELQDKFGLLQKINRDDISVIERQNEGGHL